VRALQVLLASVGLVLGGAAALIWHYTRIRSGDYGWFAYAPLRTSAIYPRRPGWWPTVLIFPSIGLVLGLLVGFGLTRLGWRFTRVRARA
jgi:hypothetical protein